MSEESLTREQREFATKWHNLIYTFLGEKRLPVEDYYDIVVFGFLRVNMPCKMVHAHGCGESSVTGETSPASRGRGQGAYGSSPTNLPTP